jgi:UDP-N-acetylglucosamine 1-carboxyvinyltransferase
MLIKMGAKIEGHGTSRIRIQGVEAPAWLRPTRWWPTASRRALSCARWRPPAGCDVLRHGRADHLEAVVEKLRDAGAKVTDLVDGGIRVQSRGA